MSPVRERPEEGQAAKEDDVNGRDSCKAEISIDVASTWLD